MQEHESHPRDTGERNPESLDFEHLHRTARRFEDRITAGISAAHAEQREIDDSCARLIAHVLGRAYGRHSGLAAFGRTGTGSYDDLREEYLDLYVTECASADIREWIDWFGTYLIQRERDNLLPPHSAHSTSNDP